MLIHIKFYLLRCNNLYIILSNIYARQSLPIVVFICRIRMEYLRDATTVKQPLASKQASLQWICQKQHQNLHTHEDVWAALISTLPPPSARQWLQRFRKNAEFQKRLLNNQLDYKNSTLRRRYYQYCEQALQLDIGKCVAAQAKVEEEAVGATFN